jgi:1-acyl-sn-glycerol-3-phosphate acyltransferase
MRAWGGFMVDRSKGSNQVQLIADHIKSQEQILIVVAPSGTRSKTDCWKSGFYYIALTANVPVLCCFLDYARKEGGIGPSVHLTGNVSDDMDQIRAFYADKTGKRPEKATPIRLKDEIAEPPEIKT